MAARKKKPPSAPSTARAGKATASTASEKKPAKKRASPSLSPQQRAANTRRANREAAEAASLRRSEAAKLGWERRREAETIPAPAPKPALKPVKPASAPAKQPAKPTPAPAPTLTIGKLKVFNTKPAKKLTPAQKAANTRAIKAQRLAEEAAAAKAEQDRREAEEKARLEAIALKRREAAAKAKATREETERVVEKGSRVKLTRAELAFLEERSKKCRSQAVCAGIYAALAFQQKREDEKGPTQKIKETLIKLRREAIKKKVGWYPTKLIHSTFETDARPGPGSTWLETRTSPMYVEQMDGSRKLEDVTFGYNRRHERIGRVLTEASLDEIKKQIAARYRELYAESKARVDALDAKKPPGSPLGMARGYIQIYAYTIAKDKDASLSQAYADFVRLRPPQKAHRIGKGDITSGPIIQEDPDNKLMLLPESSGISPDPTAVIEGMEEAINRWLMTLDRPVIVDSFFISIEERPFEKKK